MSLSTEQSVAAVGVMKQYLENYRSSCGTGSLMKARDRSIPQQELRSSMTTEVQPHAGKSSYP